MSNGWSIEAKARFHVLRPKTEDGRKFLFLISCYCSVSGYRHLGLYPCRYLCRNSTHRRSLMSLDLMTCERSVRRNLFGPVVASYLLIKYRYARLEEAG